MKNRVHLCDALDLLGSLGTDTIDVIYVDPPFGTGQVQGSSRTEQRYDDPCDGYIGWLREHVIQFHRVLRDSGTLYLHLDHHWVHYAKVMVDDEFGSDCFMNEVIWSYDFGGRGRRCWPRKHDSILVYSRMPGRQIFNWDDIDRVPYAAPEMQRVGRSPEDAERRIKLGKVPTDVWAMSIVGTSARERTGYPTQKPVRLVERAIRASSPPHGVVLDVFAGSGTTGEAATRCGRSFVLCDSSASAFETMKRRFGNLDVSWHEGASSHV